MQGACSDTRSARITVRHAARPMASPKGFGRACGAHAVGVVVSWFQGLHAVNCK